MRTFVALIVTALAVVLAIYWLTPDPIAPPPAKGISNPAHPDNAIADRGGVPLASNRSPLYYEDSVSWRQEIRLAINQLGAQIALSQGDGPTPAQHLAAAQQVLVLSRWSLARALPDSGKLLREVSTMLPDVPTYHGLRSQLQADAATVDGWLQQRDQLHQQLQRLPSLLDALPHHPAYRPVNPVNPVNPTDPDTEAADKTVDKTADTAGWFSRVVHSMFVVGRYPIGSATPPDALQQERMLIGAQRDALMLERAFVANSSTGFVRAQQELVAKLQRFPSSQEQTTALETVRALQLTPAPRVQTETVLTGVAP